MKKRRIHSFFALVAAECRKAFGNPWTVISFVCLLLLNGWKLADQYRQYTRRWEPYGEQYRQCYDQYSGQITPEKIREIMTIYAPLEEKWNRMSLDYRYSPDAYTFSEGMDEEFYRTLFVEEMKYDYLYQNEAYRIADQAAQLADVYKNLGNSFASEKNEKIYRDFAGRIIPTFSDTRGWEVLLRYDFSSMLILLLTLFALCGMFSTERETEMYMLLRTTRYGNRMTTWAKLTAAALFTLCVSIAFYLEDFWGIYWIAQRREALNAPVYALRYMERTPLRISVSAYFLRSASVRTLGVWCLGIWILFLSTFCVQGLSAFLSGLLLIVCGAFVQSYAYPQSFLRICNSMELILFRELVARDVFVNVLGRAFRLYAVAIFGAVAVSLCGIAGIFRRTQSCHMSGGRMGRAAK